MSPVFDRPRVNGVCFARVAAAALAAAGLVCAAAVGGCSGDESTEISLFGKDKEGVKAARPPKDLTLEEGKKLLAEINKDPKRMQKLTMAEKRFLAKLAAAEEEDDLRDRGLR